jgi:hypothetical protein
LHADDFQLPSLDPVKTRFQHRGDRQKRQVARGAHVQAAQTDQRILVSHVMVPQNRQQTSRTISGHLEGCSGIERERERGEGTKNKKYHETQLAAETKWNYYSYSHREAFKKHRIIATGQFNQGHD